MKKYIRRAISLTSLVFTILVAVNLLTNKKVLFTIIEYLFFISVVSGVLIFLVEDNESYSNRRLLLNQVLYIGIIFMMILLGNVLFHWALSYLGLLSNFILVIGIFFFIKLFMYGQDKKEADKINRYIQEKKKLED